MKVIAKILNAFSVQNRGGNPAAVVLDADRLTSQQKQEIATKVGLSETAFVSPSSVAEFKLDFFTPVKQIPHCGHATIGTFTYLKKNGMIKGERSSKETIDGVRQIIFKGDFAYMEQRSPSFIDVEAELDNILDSLNLRKEHLQQHLKPQIVSTGNRFLIVPVRDDKTISEVVPNFDAIRAFSERFNLIGYYLFSTSPDTQIQATTRMFAPYYGIEEESATGMAAGPLACYLSAYSHKHQQQFLIEQGKFMKVPSASILHADLNIHDNVIRSVYVGGDAFLSHEIVVEI
jgi:PhzF family phenazine biosynthesis protein